MKCLRCKKVVQRRSSSHKRCPICAKEAKTIWRKNHRKEINAMKRQWAKDNPQSRLSWIKNNLNKYRASRAMQELRKFLKLIGLSENCDPRNVVLNYGVTNIVLEKIANGNGYPDFKDECLEEKGPKTDSVRATQWARAILEYRSGRKYKVAWRYTSTKRRIFQTVFDFYEWQQKRGIEEKTKWQHKHKKR